jgi:hypothetical protein
MWEFGVSGQALVLQPAVVRRTDHMLGAGQDRVERRLLF